MNDKTISIKDYLNQKDIKFKEANGELITDCVFCNKPQHLYFNSETSQYDCKVCGEQGNIITLAKHLGDPLDKVFINEEKPKRQYQKQNSFDAELIYRCAEQLPDRIKNYLNNRGINNNLIEEFKLGYGEFYGKNWITIPILSKDGEPIFIKLRQDPDDATNDSKYKFYPTGKEAALYGIEHLGAYTDTVVICEGELDAIILQSFGIPAVTSTAGANTFKAEWLDNVKHIKKIYVCLDKDEAGIKGAEKIIKLLNENLTNSYIYQIQLPEKINPDKDITDYFIKYNATPDEFFALAKHVGGKKPIDTSDFWPISIGELNNILGLTIKKDDENKLVSFLCELSAYTENSQFNISFNAPSSTGKSYIPTEVARLFPEEDVVEIGYCTPTAFFHDTGQFNKERGGYEINLSRKILIFLDQPHTALLERLRPLLSHDKKEMHLKITDKTGRGGMKTKNVFIKGFPSVIFCSAGLQIDEQEGTRFLLLSPETSQEKIREAIQEKIKKETDKNSYNQWLEANQGRLLLKQRIEAIREEKIDDIKVPEPEKIAELFLKNKNILKPRHQRDIGRLISLIKAFTLLNVWFRKKEDNIVWANEDDVKNALSIWSKLSESQEYNLPPYIYDLFRQVIIPAYNDKNANSGYKIGITRQEVLKKHFSVYGRMVEDFKLRQQILPMLETAGLITQEPDQNDKRKILISPTTEPTIDNIVSETGE